MYTPSGASGICCGSDFTPTPDILGKKSWCWCILFCSVISEQWDGGAAEDSDEGGNPRVQVPGSPPAAGLHGARGGEHHTAEARVHSEAEPGTAGHICVPHYAPHAPYKPLTHAQHTVHTPLQTYIPETYHTCTHTPHHSCSPHTLETTSYRHTSYTHTIYAHTEYTIYTTRHTLLRWHNTHHHTIHVLHTYTKQCVYKTLSIFVSHILLTLHIIHLPPSICHTTHPVHISHMHHTFLFLWNDMSASLLVYLK